MRKRTEKILEGLLNFLADFGAYLFCLIGVAGSRYVPFFKEGIEPDFVFSWFRLGMSALIALMIFGTFESVGSDGSTEEAKKLHREGKRRRWLRRIVFALSQGFMWEQIIG